MDSVSCCSHKYLGRLERAEKKGRVLLSPLPDFRDQGSQPSTFPKKGARRRKAMPSGNIFRGNMKKTRFLTGFSTIFRGLKRILNPLAMPQVVEGMHLC